MEVGGIVANAAAVPVAYTPERKTAVSSPVVREDIPQSPPVTDSLTLSQEARERKLVEEELALRQRQKEARRALLASLLEPGEDRVIPAESMGKCARIAERIMGGDQVPEEDQAYLMNNAPQLYRQSIMMRQAGDEAEVKESLLDESDLAENDVAQAVGAVLPELRRVFEKLWAIEDLDSEPVE